MVRQGHASSAMVIAPAVLGPIAAGRRPARTRRLARRSLRSAATLLKILIAVPLGLAALAAWLLGQLLKL